MVEREERETILYKRVDVDSKKFKKKKTLTCPGLGRGLGTFFGDDLSPPKTVGTNGAKFGAFFVSSL